MDIRICQEGGIWHEAFFKHIWLQHHFPKEPIVGRALVFVGTNFRTHFFKGWEEPWSFSRSSPLPLGQAYPKASRWVFFFFFLVAFLPQEGDCLDCIGLLPAFKSHSPSGSEILYKINWGGWQGPGECLLYFASVSFRSFLLLLYIRTGWVCIMTLGGLGVPWMSFWNFFLARHWVHGCPWGSSVEPFQISLPQMFLSHPHSPKGGSS